VAKVKEHGPEICTIRPIPQTRTSLWQICEAWSNSITGNHVYSFAVEDEYNLAKKRTFRIDRLIEPNCPGVFCSEFVRSSYFLFDTLMPKIMRTSCGDVQVLKFWLYETIGVMTWDKLDYLIDLVCETAISTWVSILDVCRWLEHLTHVESRLESVLTKFRGERVLVLAVLSRVARDKHHDPLFVQKWRGHPFNPSLPRKFHDTSFVFNKPLF